MIRLLSAALMLAATATPVAAHSRQNESVEERNAYLDAATSLERLVNDWYAYRERLPGGEFRLTRKLSAEARLVANKRELLRFAERALLLLADHHAITSASFADSWAVVPSYSDLWIEQHGNRFVITAVRAESPAAQAGIETGAQLVAVDGVPTAKAVADFWADLGAEGGGIRNAFAARILAAGRRDRLRKLAIQAADGSVSHFTLSSLYDVPADLSAIEIISEPALTRIKFNDSLGRSDVVAAFDEAMAGLPEGRPVVLDFSDTPSGGNTTVARAIMGWFVTEARPYQRHALPAEERRTGIARQWIELVAPRPGKFHAGKVDVAVGRWTGSMGEGLAIGFDALGKCVFGTSMAGLLGATGDFQLGDTSLAIKLPYERLSAVDGTPREDFVPQESCE